ncbi:putative uncharacterized protein DDB_G0290521, partial [Trematomus bernacchii]|uniref:putative uncharacterized protein DDB_G0290521 n=1 Tax=Trematomus bernacchii TaxID=40690 RepID=UPI00146A02DB
NSVWPTQAPSSSGFPPTQGCLPSQVPSPVPTQVPSLVPTQVPTQPLLRRRSH